MNVNSKQLEATIDSLLESYIKRIWRTRRESINKHQARDELLGGGLFYFYKKGSSESLNTFTAPYALYPNPNPIHLDSYGVHPDIYVEYDFSVEIKDRHGEVLAIVNCEVDKEV